MSAHNVCFYDKIRTFPKLSQSIVFLFEYSEEFPRNANKTSNELGKRTIGVRIAGLTVSKNDFHAIELYRTGFDC